MSSVLCFRNLTIVWMSSPCLRHFKTVCNHVYFSFWILSFSILFHRDTVLDKILKLAASSTPHSKSCLLSRGFFWLSIPRKPRWWEQWVLKGEIIKECLYKKVGGRKQHVQGFFLPCILLHLVYSLLCKRVCNLLRNMTICHFLFM